MTDKGDRKELDCLVEYDGELVKIDLIFENGQFYGIWQDGDLNDSVWDWDSFQDEFGDEYYDGLADYKRDDIKSFTDWVEENIGPNVEHDCTCDEE